MGQKLLEVYNVPAWCECLIVIHLYLPHLMIFLYIRSFPATYRRCFKLFLSPLLTRYMRLNFHYNASWSLNKDQLNKPLLIPNRSLHCSDIYMLEFLVPMFLCKMLVRQTTGESFLLTFREWQRGRERKNRLNPWNFNMVLTFKMLWLGIKLCSFNQLVARMGGNLLIILFKI